MDLDKLKVVELRKELHQRGLDTKGVKAALVKRLKDALDAESQDSSETKVDPKPQQEEEEEESESNEPEETSHEKEPPKATSPKKDPAPAPSTPKKEASPVKKDTPSKQAVKVEPVTPKPAPEVEAKQNDEPMETETRGEKRKRDEEDEEEDEVQEKKRREDNSEATVPIETANAVSVVEETAAPVKERAPPKEDEPELDYEKPHLSWFDSDLHLKIDDKTFLSAKPLNDGCFGYIWAGARATHGISAGKICFEVKITEELKWEDLSDRMQEKTDRQLNQKYKIDRRNERKEESKDKSEKAEGEDAKETSVESKTTEENGEKAEEPQSETGENIKEGEEGKATEEQKSENDASASGEEKKEKTQPEVEKPEAKSALPPIPTHFFRVGFSTPGSSLQLGEVPYSYAYESTGKFITDGKFEDYGVTYGVGDVIGAYLSIDNQNLTITYTVNGALQPTAIAVPRSELPQDQFSLFPHVLCRNYAYELNFGAREEPWFPHPEELKTYQFLQQIEQKVEGPRRPEKREDCEVLLMIGLPGSGKTQWVKNHIAANIDKNYTVIGNHPLFDRMTVEGQSMKSRFRGSWKILVDRIQKCLNQLTDRAALRRRNYIIDQTNVFPNAQRRKLRSFEGFNRKAVIVVCEDEEHARRQKDQQNDYGKTVPESTMYDLKAQMELPQKCEWVEELIFTDLGEEEARQKVKTYNEEANKKGYYKRWMSDNRKHPRNYRPGLRRPGGFGPGRGRFGRYPPQGPGWNRPPPSWGGRKDARGPPPTYRQVGAPWKPPQRGPPRAPEQNRQRYNRNVSSYGGGRNQGSRNNWQNDSASNWGSGNTQGGWNAAVYGAHGYGAWNQNSASAQQTAAWKYGATQSTYSSGQGQRNYGGSQGYGTNQSYGSQGGYSQSGYQGSGYSDGWNYYGQYGQQQGWGNHQKRQ